MPEARCGWETGADDDHCRPRRSARSPPVEANGPREVAEYSSGAVTDHVITAGLRVNHRDAAILAFGDLPGAPVIIGLGDPILPITRLRPFDFLNPGHRRVPYAAGPGWGLSQCGWPASARHIRSRFTTYTHAAIVNVSAVSAKHAGRNTLDRTRLEEPGELTGD